MGPELTTKRLTMRGPLPSDLEDLFAIYSDSRAMTYWSTPPHPDTKETQAHLDRWLNGFDAAPYYFAIVHQGRVIGTCGAHTGNEVGFILHPDVWRQGIAKEAMQAVIDHLWQVTDFAELTADLDPRNDASEGLLLALGFQKTGTAKNTYCVDGVWTDSLYMARKRPVGFCGAKGFGGVE
ncbi:GNAT family protein [Aliiroseovarius sp. F47248L]|uniref:GNAT family N-acetyltransferase n=1 Tax=Aliiroseovarius sp. F47248L TaxID=2926420 RepID=UPI001FF227AB|nr:GNAT family protein [Aliiroseovarius sp. F47248L]MCK0138259.1 GNAT family N-acetyltransferase [Aliiroseovarius sp. F47248L]